MFQLALDYLQETQSQVGDRIINFLPTNHSSTEVEKFYRMMMDYPTRAG